MPKHGLHVICTLAFIVSILLANLTRIIVFFGSLNSIISDAIDFIDLFFYILSPLLVGAQVDTDSLKQIWSSDLQPDSKRYGAINTYYLNYTYKKPDSAFHVAKYHLQLASERNEIIEMAKALNEQALIYYLKGKYNKAMSTLLGLN